jgi:signal transduction histidine kinase
MTRKTIAPTTSVDSIDSDLLNNLQSAEFLIKTHVHLVHEIRNPLTNIYLAVDAIQVISDNKKLPVFLNIIRNNAARINALVGDMLRSAGDESGIKKYNINQVMDRALELAMDRIMLKNILVTKSYTDQPCDILIDILQVKMALVNIVLNAIEAMPSQNGELKIGTAIANGKNILTIHDNGTGISKENMQKIFAPYFTSKKNGMGLGLTVTFDILKLHKAEIEVESDEHTGTRFMISFPNC